MRREDTREDTSASHKPKLRRTDTTPQGSPYRLQPRSSSLTATETKYEWPILPEATLKKIKDFELPHVIPEDYILPDKHDTWFYWWVSAHTDMKVNIFTVEQCLHDARQDGVIPDNIGLNKKIEDVADFVGIKLYSVRHTLFRQMTK